MNIMQLLQGNPKVAIQNLMNSHPEVSSNPIAQNAIQMMKDNNISGLKAMAQNLYRERGLDINQAYNQISAMFGNK